MSSSSNSYDADSVVEEEKKLETALYDSDRLLQDALRADDRRRCVRRRVLFSLIAGGIVMGTIIIAALAGWLTLFSPPPTASQEASVDVDAWVQRLTGLRDHMHTAFGVGPDLSLLDPDTGVEIVRKAWPQIQENQVKTGLLKTFAFSKTLPKKHARVLQVLDIGMHDEDAEVRNYAAAYVKEYSGTDFSTDPQGYAKWYQANKAKDPEALLAAAEKNTSEGTKPKKPAVDRKTAVAKAAALADQGWDFWRQQKMTDAADAFEQCVSLNPADANSWNGLGWARLGAGNDENAIDAFEKCVELQRNHPAGLNGLGQIYLGWGDFDKAEKYLLKSASSPHSAAAWFGLARIYLLTGRYEKAQPWLRKALKEQPEDATLKSMLDAATSKSLSPDLKQQLQPKGKLERSTGSAAAVDGWRLFNAGKPAEAELSFNRALAKDPDNSAAMNGLGFLLLNSGKAAEAKSYFEKCLEKEPNAAGPMNGLARCLKEEGKVDEAIALWEKMCKQNPGVNAGTIALATTYAEKKQFDKALHYYEQLVKSQPESEEYKRGLEEAKKALQSKQP